MRLLIAAPRASRQKPLVLSQSICRRDPLRASAALSCIYAQMDEKGLLAPHAYAIQTYIGADTYVQSVHQALLYLWYLRGFEAPAQFQNAAPDDEGPEP